MEVHFIGAARTVTGSKHLIITDKGVRILLDCGLFQNKGSDHDTINRHLGFDPMTIDVMILSHAHIDHSGNIPTLVKQGYKGKIYCTPPTLDLCTIMLADSAHIHESDVKYINEKRIKKDQKIIEPLYTMADVTKCMPQFKSVNFDTYFKIDDDIEFAFTDNGHILGSAAINLRIKEDGHTKKLTFTGDIGRPHDKILKPPAPFPQADYILTESTYGNRLHDTSENAEKKLLEVVLKPCVAKKGKLIIPAFSLGRTQEIVYALDRMKKKGLLPPIKVFVDSPLSVNVTDIMRKYIPYFNKQIHQYLYTDKDPFGFNGLTYIKDVEDSIALNSLKEPCIIISASGMMEAGRIKHHLKNNIPYPENTVLIVGYCPENTLGHRLIRGDKEVTIYGKAYPVNADIEVIHSYSSHGDYNEMMAYLSCQEKTLIKKLFLVHGEYEVQKEYKEHLTQEGFFHIEIPEAGSVYKLD